MSVSISSLSDPSQMEHRPPVSLLPPSIDSSPKR
jgi:hypothetical protein